MNRILNIVAFVLVLIAAIGVGSAIITQRVRQLADVNARGTLPPSKSEATARDPDAIPSPALAKLDRHYSWPEVERILEKLRSKRKKEQAARLDLESWYSYLANPAYSSSNNASDHCSRLAAIQKQFPDSSALLVTLAKANLQHAWADASGPNGATTEAKRLLVQTRMEEAHRLLDQAITMGVKDGEAYALLLECARGEGLSLEQAHSFVAAGQTIDSSYFAIYKAMTEYLLFASGGQVVDIERFAKGIYETLAGDDGLEAYFHVAHTLYQYDASLLFEAEFDRNLLAKGAEVVVKRYAKEKNFVSFAAICTMIAQDRGTARRIRSAIQKDDLTRVGIWRAIAPEFIRWCTDGENTATDSEWLWGAPFNFGPIVFGSDPHAIWCIAGQEPVSLGQWNLETRTLWIVPPAMGNRLHGLVCDSGKNWLAARLGGEQSNGWMLWRPATDSEPYYHSTAGTCQAIAINPRSPQIAWAVGKTVRIIDMNTMREDRAIEISEDVRSLRFAGNGKSLVVGGRRLSVWDIATGGQLFELPTGASTPESRIACEQILDVDEEGHIWAIACIIGSLPAERPVVRFAPDGKKWDVIIPNLQMEANIQPLSAVISSDRRLLAVVQSDTNLGEPETIQIWDLAMGRMKQRISGSSRHIGSIALSPDGRRLASVGLAGGPLNIWLLQSEHGN